MGAPAVASAAVGTHWIGDFGDCACDPVLLASAVSLQALCERLVTHSGLHAVGRLFHQFEPAGATGMVLLAESHLAVHTWPERRFVSVDLYVCNHGQDNAERARALFHRLQEAFQPSMPGAQVVLRGPRAAAT